MGRGKRLTNEELAVIKAYKDTGLSNREIAKKIKRSPKVVINPPSGATDLTGTCFIHLLLSPHRSAFKSRSF